MIQKANKFSSISLDIYYQFILVERNGDFYNLPGIYMIKNDITQDIYIGQSKSVGYRLTSHRSLLRNNNHVYKNNKYDILQKSWNKYGEKAFSFWIVEFVEESRLDEREIYWIQYFNCNRVRSQKGFNLNNGGTKPPTGSSNKNRVHLYNPQTNKHLFVYPDQLTEYLSKGFKRGVPPQQIQKGIKTKIKNGTNISGMRGKHHSDQWKQNQKKNLTNRITIHKENKEKRVKVGQLLKFLNQGWKRGSKKRKPYKSNPNKTKKVLTESQIKKLKESKYKPVFQYDLSGKLIQEFPSLKEASEKTNICLSYLCRCCKHPPKKSKYPFIFTYK